MKLRRYSQTERPLKGKDILRQEGTETTGLFEIERDVRPSDWQRAKEQLDDQWNQGRVFELALSVSQLVLLGKDNQSGVDMERWKRRALIQAKDELGQAKLKHDPAEVSEKVVAWLIVQPEARKEILATELDQQQQTALWQRFEKLAGASQTNPYPQVAVALFFLFPAQRDRVRAGVSLESLTQALQNRLANDEQLWTGAYYLALAISLLFPGNRSDMLPANIVNQQRHVWGRDFLTMHAVTTLYLLTADEVRVGGNGEVVVMKTTSVLKSKAEMPARDLV